MMECNLTHKTTFRESLKQRQLKPKAAEMYYNCGLAYFSKGDYQQASLEFGNAVRLAPENEEMREALEKARELTIICEILRFLSSRIG